MNIEDLAKYPVKKQVQYFLKIATKNKTEVDVLKAMRNNKHGKEFWPDAYETLFFTYGDKKLSYCESRFQKHGECSVGHLAHITIAELMMRNVRLSWNAYYTVIQKATVDDDMRNELKKYLSRGKVNDSMCEVLINAVTTDPGSADLQMLDVLLDYVRRYGLSDKFMGKCYAQYPKEIANLVNEEHRK